MLAPTASMVPSTNRGLKTSHGSPRGQSAEQTLAIVDFLTFSAPWSAMVTGYGHATSLVRARAVEGDESWQYAIADWLVDETFPDSGLIVERERRGFRNFYDHHFRILTPNGDNCGFVALGGERQRSTVCLSLTGSGCAHVKAWAQVRDALERYGASISRVDVAHDDFDGLFTVDDAAKWHAAGLFNAGGRPPAIEHRGWNDGSGRTVYIGKNTGNQQLCVYEKGRQQGARDGDKQAGWVRWEGRFGSKYRDIPLDVLTEPAAYLVGHFPALRGWLQATAMRMRTSVERATANLSSAVRHAKRQTGALVNLIKQHVPEPSEFAAWIVRHVARDRVPAWLKVNPLGPGSLQHAFQT